MYAMKDTTTAKVAIVAPDTILPSSIVWLSSEVPNLYTIIGLVPRSTQKCGSFSIAQEPSPFHSMHDHYNIYQVHLKIELVKVDIFPHRAMNGRRGIASPTVGE